MDSRAEKNDRTSLGTILSLACDQEVTTRAALAVAAGGRLAGGKSSRSMVERVIGGQLPKLLRFRRWIGDASLLPDALKAQLVEWFLRPTPFRAVPREDVDRTLLDPTGDQIIDARDTVAFGVQVVSKASEAMGKLTKALADGRCSEVEASEVRSVLHEIEEIARQGRATLDAVDSRRTDRVTLAGPMRQRVG